MPPEAESDRSGVAMRRPLGKYRENCGREERGSEARKAMSRHALNGVALR